MIIGNMKMIRFCTFVVLLLSVSVGGRAQKLLVQDTEGNPIPYAHILSHSGAVLEMTNLDGTVDMTPIRDQAEGKPVTVTHVAFKPVDLSLAEAGQTQKVEMEEADFSMDEVVVSPKDYLYVQTYYRVIYMKDDTVVYYRSGLIDNTYDVKKKSLKTDSRHFSKANMGLIKFVLDKLAGGRLEDRCRLPVKSGKGSSEISRSKVSPTREELSIGGQKCGFVVIDRESRQQRMSVDMNVVLRHYFEKEGKQKRLKRQEQKKNDVSNYYVVYQTDEEGHYGIEDFKMLQYHIDYDSYDRVDKKDEHTRIWLESYNTDRAYVTKKELKERKKQNRREMNIESMRQFELDHGVPPLAPQFQQRLDVLFKKAE